MKVLYLYCHPFRKASMPASGRKPWRHWRRPGTEVDLFDLYAEGFDPVLSEEGRRDYHDTTRNRAGLEPAIVRLMRAEGAGRCSFPPGPSAFPRC